MARAITEKTSARSMGSTKSAKKSAKTATAPPAVARAEIAAAVEGNEAAYVRFLPNAQQLDATAIKPFRADASLAYHNVDAGVKAVTAARSELDARVRSIDWTAIAALPDLALAVCFAASQVATAAPPATGIAEKLALARKLRTVLITGADALAAAGLLPAAAVAKIHVGQGPIDTANDCVDLAALFRKHEQDIRGRHAVTKAQLAAAATVGSDLVTLLRPKRARAGTKPVVLTDAISARDRLWTLLIRGHTELRRLGAFHWIDEVNEHVPQLQAHHAQRAKKKPAPVVEDARDTGK